MLDCWCPFVNPKHLQFQMIWWRLVAFRRSPTCAICRETLKERDLDGMEEELDEYSEEEYDSELDEEEIMGN